MFLNDVNNKVFNCFTLFVANIIKCITNTQKHGRICRLFILVERSVVCPIWLFLSVCQEKLLSFVYISLKVRLLWIFRGSFIFAEESLPRK